MIKVAVLFQEEETKHMDLSHPELGNPGVGGTAFCFLLLLKFYKTINRNSEVELSVYQFQDNILPAENTTKVASIEEALNKAKADGNEIMLLRNHQTDEVYECLKKYDFKYIFWMHNKLTYKEIRMFDSWENCKRVIAVGREMYDYYLDDNIIDKLDYILNPFVPPNSDVVRKADYEPNVVYVGSLTYDKNFHLITAIWREVLAAVPNARLHVIGSGRLYDKDSRLGRFGQADEAYENMFMPPILDEEGNPLTSVVFHGILGNEKYDVFQNAAVGLINPMGTETFGLAAIEMEAVGVPVTCRRKNGLPDSVCDGKTGILYKNIDELATSIITLLQDRTLNERLSMAARQFARNDFLPEHIMPRWEQVFTEVHSGMSAKRRKAVANLDNNNKRMRILLNYIHRVPFLRRVPSVHDIQKK